MAKGMTPNFSPDMLDCRTSAKNALTIDCKDRAGTRTRLKNDLVFRARRFIKMNRCCLFLVGLCLVCEVGGAGFGGWVWVSAGVGVAQSG